MTQVTMPSTMQSARHSATREHVGPARWGLLELFVISQTVLPALLYLPGTQPLRVPIRVSAFGISLALLAWHFANRRKREVRKHPAWPWLIAVLCWLAIQIGHPTTNTFAAGFAQVMLYFSVLIPVIWAPPLITDRQQISRLLTIILVCNGINSVVGVLQVLNPDRWLPREYSSVALEQYGGAPLGYEGADGKFIVRPPGLSDNPGAVCGPAMIATMLGLIIAAGRYPAWKRAMAAFFAFCGAAAIYLSQVRTSILIAGGALVVYALVLVLQRERGRAVAFTATAVGAFAAAFAFAVAIGGSAVIDRFATLIEDDPTTVYYKAGRGYQLEKGLPEYLSNYPLGAGLGRWGMMRFYFGDDSNIRSPMVWAELQLPAWVLDGGFVLIVLYCGALIVNTLYEFRLATRSPDPSLRYHAGIIFACNASIVAIIFGYTPFTTYLGMQYWFLAAVLHGTAMLNRRATLSNPPFSAGPQGRGFRAFRPRRILSRNGRAA
jgi:hypothetical protein